MNAVGCDGYLPVKSVPHLEEMRCTRFSSEQDIAIKKVASRALLEIGAALVLNAFVSFYFVTDSMVYICAMLILREAHILVDVGRHIFKRLVLDRFASDGAINRPDRFWVDLSIVNLIGQSGIFTLFHEIGHALASLICYKGANPKISISPFEGGYTSFSPSTLSWLGRRLGGRASLALVLLGGPIASVLIATTAMALSHCWEKSHPRLSYWVGLFGYGQLLQEVMYGLCFLSNSGTDFRRFQNLTGIHPLLSVAATILVPLTVLSWLSESSKCPEQSRSEP